MKLCRLADQTIAYAEQGSGPPVLLVHGFPLSHAMWRFQIEALSDAFRVIAPDLRGFGESRAELGDPQTASLTMETHADDLAALLDALDMSQPVAFCGLSMGGYIAWQFWRRHRQRIGKMILCDTRSAADDDAAQQKRYELAERVLGAGSEIVADAMMPKLFWQDAIDRNSQVAAETRQVICNTSAATIAAALRGMAERSDAADLLPEIDVPTLLLGGEHDAITAPDEMRGIAAAIEGAKFVAIPNAGHMSPLENPAAVNAALRAFLRD